MLTLNPILGSLLGPSPMGEQFPSLYTLRLLSSAPTMGQNIYFLHTSMGPNTQQERAPAMDALAPSIQAQLLWLLWLKMKVVALEGL